MKSLLLAAGLTLVFHGLLFTLKLDWSKKEINSAPAPDIITLTLTYKENPPEARTPTIGDVDKKEIPMSLKQPPRVKREKVKTPKTHSTSPEKKAVTAGAEEEAQPIKAKENPLSADSANPAQGMYSGLSSQGGTGADIPSEETTGDSWTTTSLPSAPVREAKPLYRRNPPPKYPASARRRGYEGTATVEALVDKEGRVQDLRLYQSSGHPVLDQAAMASVREWLFEPATLGKEKVEKWVKVPVRFQLE